MSNLQNVPLQSFEIDFISQLTEFCLHEIALEGLRGISIFCFLMFFTIIISVSLRVSTDRSFKFAF
jgi:hypothetical protein